MKLSKIISNESIQFEVTPSELDFISFALDDYEPVAKRQFCQTSALKSIFDSHL